MKTVRTAEDSRVRPLHRWRALGALIFLVVLFPYALGAQTFKNLSQARQAASAAKTQDALRSIIFAAIPQLSVRDGIALCREFEPAAGAQLKTELRGTLGSMYLLLGQIADAASWYAKAATLDPKYTVEAARLSMALGDSSSVDALAQSEGISKEAKGLLDVWGLLLDGNYVTARARIKEALASSSNAQVKSELLFLQYVADFAQYGAAQPTIIKEFPASMGSDLISGKAFPAPNFLIALGISWLSGSAPLHDYGGAIAQPTKNDSSQKPKDDSALGSAAQWLQVGYFSLRENAARLSSTLASKHFETRLVEIKNKDGEMRWLVQVAAAKNWQETQAALKDLGYESYLVSP